MSRRSQGAITAAIAITLPWIVVWLATGVFPWLFTAVLDMAYTVPAVFLGLSTYGVVLVTGLSVLGASFLLAWGAETAEKDVPRAFAIAVLAVVAVAPEYAVDALYAWEAGLYAETPRGIEAGNLAVANMTGANRILIGVGWAGIALFTVYRAGAARDPAVEQRDGFLTDVVVLDRDLALEIVFLLLATLWAFLVPLNNGIDIVDMLVLVGLYVAYIAIILRGDVEPEEIHVGVPSYLREFRRPARIAAVMCLFVYSGIVILIAVEPFAHGLEDIGVDLGIPSFFMIQWIAPLASESPELIVVAYLVNKARSTAGFNALISSKLNQWTLLIGTLVVVYSIALGRYGVLTFDLKQTGEIWLTAAQSFFAIALLINFEISIREALLLLGLFLSQVAIEFIVINDLAALPLESFDFLLVYTGVYLVLGGYLFVRRWREFRWIVHRTAGTVNEALGRTSDQAPRADD